MARTIYVLAHPAGSPAKPRIYSSVPPYTAWSDVYVDGIDGSYITGKKIRGTPWGGGAAGFAVGYTLAFHGYRLNCDGATWSAGHQANPGVGGGAPNSVGVYGDDPSLTCNVALYHDILLVLDLTAVHPENGADIFAPDHDTVWVALAPSAGQVTARCVRGTPWTYTTPGPAGVFYSSGGATVIDGVGDTDLWVAGVGSATGADSVKISHWNGAAWSTQYTKSVYWAMMGQLFVLDANNAWLVAGYYMNSGDPYIPLIVYWNGATWAAQDVSALCPDTRLTGVWGFEATDIFATGIYTDPTTFQEQARVLHWDGGSWSLLSGYSAINGTRAYGAWGYDPSTPGTLYERSVGPDLISVTDSVTVEKSNGPLVVPITPLSGAVGVRTDSVIDLNITAGDGLPMADYWCVEVMRANGIWEMAYEHGLPLDFRAGWQGEDSSCLVIPTGFHLVLDPTAPFAEGALVYVRVTAFDTAGNPARM